MYFRSSSQTKSPVGSTSADRNGDGGRQNIAGPNKDNQTVSFLCNKEKRTNCGRKSAAICSYSDDHKTASRVR